MLLFFFVARDGAPHTKCRDWDYEEYLVLCSKHVMVIRVWRHTPSSHKTDREKMVEKARHVKTQAKAAAKRFGKWMRSKSGSSDGGAADGGSDVDDLFGSSSGSMDAVDASLDDNGLTSSSSVAGKIFSFFTFVFPPFFFCCDFNFQLMENVFFLFFSLQIPLL